MDLVNAVNNNMTMLLCCWYIDVRCFPACFKTLQEKKLSLVRIFVERIYLKFKDMTQEMQMLSIQTNLFPSAWVPIMKIGIEEIRKCPHRFVVKSKWNVSSCVSYISVFNLNSKHNQMWQGGYQPRNRMDRIISWIYKCYAISGATN